MASGRWSRSFCGHRFSGRGVRNRGRGTGSDEPEIETRPSVIGWLISKTSWNTEAMERGLTSAIQQTGGHGHEEGDTDEEEQERPEGRKGRRLSRSADRCEDQEAG